MTIWLEDGLKNQDQSVETASGKLVTSSESHSDDIWKFVTPSGSAKANDSDVMLIELIKNTDDLSEEELDDNDVLGEE
ncbi:hypothetical protein Tco_0353114 [Tanacetum coccineum]